MYKNININISFQIKEYELSEVFHHASDDKSYEVLKMDQPSANSVDVLDGNNALSLAIEEERAEREPHVVGRRPTDPMASVSPRIYSKNGSFKTTPENKYLSRYTLYYINWKLFSMKQFNL